MLLVVTEDGTVGPVRSGASLLGWSAEERLGRHVADLVHPDDLPHVLALVEQARSTPGLRASTAARVRHRDGRWLPLDVDVIDARREPLLGGFVVRLHQGPIGAGREPPVERSTPLPEAVSFGILSADDRGWVVYANQAARTLLGRRFDDLQGEGWLDAIVADDRPKVAQVAGSVRVDGGSAVTCRVQVDGGTRWLHCRFRRLHTSPGAGWVATLNDVTSERQLEAELAHLATHDPLTGLPNRALLHDRLDVALARLARHEGTVTVCFVDLDGFKLINDEHGHAVGDALLVEVARRLQATIRATDTAARFGGDEFVVVSEGLSADEARGMARRIARMVAQPMRLDGHDVRITGSVGVTLTDRFGDPAEALLRDADQAMYRAKREGTGIEPAEGFDVSSG